jgi:broad specificity phosphatase PhoE
MAERQVRFPELFAASVVNDLDFAPTDGESPRETLRRMTPVMDGIRTKHANETTLVVGHGGSLRAAIIALMALPAESTWSFVMGNCSLSVFDTYPNNTVMLLYNDTSHLNHLGPHI